MRVDISIMFIVRNLGSCRSIADRVTMGNHTESRRKFYNNHNIDCNNAICFTSDFKLNIIKSNLFENEIWGGTQTNG